MAKITGIGGVFLKCKGDSAALAAWYQKHLGMQLEDWGGAILKWPDDKAEDGGLTVWTLLTKTEVTAVLNQLHGIPYLAAALMYGSGLRLMECLRLRVKDLDFSYNQITVRSGKAIRTASHLCPVK